MKQKRKIILASASPRRRELLSQIGLEFTVIPGQGEETITKSKPCEIVMELAQGKAKEVYMAHCANNGGQESELVIGADTIVVQKDCIMGKPKSEEDARAMLSGLCGDTHQVYTGVAFYWKENGILKTHTFYERTDVVVFPASEEEIRAYIATKDCYDKAGAYGIQGRFAAFIKKIDGDYNNVVGLPVGRVYQELKGTKAIDESSNF